MVREMRITAIASWSVSLLVFVAACGGGEKATPTPQPTVAATPTTAPLPTVLAAPTARPLQTPAPTPTSASPAPVSQGKGPQGTVTVVGLTIEPTLFIPWASSGGTKRAFANPMVDYLTYTSAADVYQVNPGLAEKWEISPDGLTATFFLRKGVQFHRNWGEVTSTDVKFAMDETMGPRSLSARRGKMVEVIAATEAVDAYTFRIKFKVPVASDAPFHVSSTGKFDLLIPSKKHIEAVGVNKAEEEPVFSGPYKLLAKENGQYIKYEAQENHWRLVPEFRYLIFLQVLEESTRMAMLRTGAADVVAVSPTAAVRLSSSGFGVKSVPDAYSPSFGLAGQFIPETTRFFDPKLPWLDKRVREAMNIAIDRQDLASSLYEGTATPSSTHSFLPWTRDWKPYPYDPTRAKQLLKDAGYANGFKMTLWMPVYAAQATEMPQLTEALSGYWAAIGIQAPVTIVQLSSMAPRIREKNTAGTSWGLAVPTFTIPYESLESYFWSKNVSQPLYHRPEIDALFEEALRAPSTEGRNRLARQAHQIIYDEYAIVPTVTAAMLWGFNPKTIGPWTPQATWQYQQYWEYIQHPTPSGTFRLRGIVD
ncbi:MAG: hypothetical protein HYX90_06445 [Chloroflexi bacterium]|nr:hypothetical protein [Chloroflexota bacterium]